MRNQVATNKTVDEAFEKFSLCRRILIKALITDYKFFQKTLSGERYCGPGIRLIKRWEVKLPDELLAQLPPSTMRLNFTCHEMREYSWLITFTTHCDAWLRSVALNSDGLDKNGRRSLFKKINNLPTIHDVVCEVAKMKVRANKSKSNSETDERELKRQKIKQSNREAAPQSRLGKQNLKKENDILRAELKHIRSEYEHLLAQKAFLKDYEDEEDGDDVCDACGEYASCVFWIWCDTCKKDTIRCNCNSCSEHPKNKCQSCKKILQWL